MKILVTGAAGLLGTSVVPALAGLGHDVVATDIDLLDPRPWVARGPRLRWLDVREREEVEECFASVGPDLVLHLAAETSPEVNDTDPDNAYLTNTVATKYVALQARGAGIPMVYVSSAEVFDGTRPTAYTEFDRPNPLSTYGVSKYEGERIVAATVAEHYIVRVGWTVGGGPARGPTFVSRILDQVRDGARTIRVPTDPSGTPTYADDFTRCLTGLLRSGVFGLYHMVSEGAGSPYDVARHILQVLGHRDLDLVEAAPDHRAGETQSIAVGSPPLRNLVLDLQGMNTMPAWPDAMAAYLHAHFPDLVDHPVRVP